MDAFHLPNIAAPPTTSWTYGDGPGALHVRVPQLTPGMLRAQIDALLLAREEVLAHRSVESIVEAIGAVAGRLLDPVDPLRTAAELRLPVITGASVAMIRLVLDRMAADWTAPRLRELLRGEFLDPRALDRFTPRHSIGGSEIRAIGPRLTTHIFSGNVPGVSVTSLIRALLVKSVSVGKSAMGEPLLATLFARGLAEVDAELGRCLAITYWPGGEGELERVALERAEAVIVYGGAEAVAAVRSRVRPDARFLGYGHRVSFGAIAREALSIDRAERVARRAALDVATFDQQGCVSPHLFYVEEDGDTSPAEWAALLARELESLETSLPRGAVSPGESTAIRQLRGEAEFAQISGHGVVLHASRGGTAWTVIHDPDPRFTASCLNRTVRVKPIASLEEIPRLLAPVSTVLQTGGFAGSEPRGAAFAEQLAQIGVSRVAEIGEMAWPAPSWLHDGRPPLGDLVRWCERSIRTE
jgi:hypothetical protein